MENNFAPKDIRGIPDEVIQEQLQKGIENLKKDDKYFTPSIEDIRVGYECEIKPTGSEVDWMPYIINGDNAFKHYETRGKGATSIRVPYLTKEQIESCGFILKAKSIDHWFQIAEDKRFDTDLQNFCGYKAYNVFLNYGFHDYRLKIKADFSGGSDYNKAETLFDGECKCINSLRQILKQIHITPFYEG